jgi:hypothetical protein
MRIDSFGHCEHFVSPYPGCVHNDARRDIENADVYFIVTTNAGNLSRGVVLNTRHLYVRRNVGSEINGGRLCERESDAGVVASSIEVQKTRNEAISVESR